MNVISEHNVRVFEHLNKITFLNSLMSCACMLQEAFQDQIITPFKSNDCKIGAPDLSDLSCTVNVVNDGLSSIIDSLIEKRDRCTKQLIESLKDNMTIEQHIASVTQSLNSALQKKGE